MSKKKPQRDHAPRKKQQQPRLPRLWQTVRFPLLLVLLALIPRLIALLQLTASPIFYHPAIDAQVYHERAVAIAAGDLMGYSTFWQAPFYSYFLGMIYWIFGVKILIAKLIQILLGSVCCYLVFRIADRLFNRQVAWISFVALALCGPMIFFELQLLAPVLLNFLVLLTLIALLRYQREPRARYLVIAGLLIGLAQITHGLIIAFLPVLFLWLFMIGRKRSVSMVETFRACVLVLVGFLPIIAMTTAHNLATDGELVLVSSNFGANFYLGNHPNYDSTTAIRPGLEWDEFVQEAAVNGHLTPAQSSSYFAGKAWHNITSNIPGYLALLGKKLNLLLAGEEIKRNLDIYHFRSYSWLLIVLLWQWVIAFPSGLAIPAALVWLGVFLFSNRESEKRQEKWLLVLFVLSQAAAILLFFVATRYRLVMAPMIAIFAAAAIWRFVESLRERRWKTTAILAIAFLALAVYSNIPRLAHTQRETAEDNFYEGLAYSKAGDVEKAVARFKAATSEQPNYAMAEQNLALMLERTGQPQQAMQILRNIVRDNPKSFMAHLIAGRTVLDFGHPALADTLFMQTLQLNPNSVEALVNLAHIQRIGGDTTAALSLLRKALSLNPRAYKAYNQMGAVYMGLHLMPQAEQYFRKSYEINPYDASTLNNLSIVMANRGLLADAAAYIELAHKLEPEALNVMLNLGAVRLKQNRVNEALELFQHAAQVAPNHPEVYQYLGMAYLSQRRAAEARRAFEHALQLDPNYTPAREQLQKLSP